MSMIVVLWSTAAISGLVLVAVLTLIARDWSRRDRDQTTLGRPR